MHNYSIKFNFFFQWKGLSSLPYKKSCCIASFWHCICVVSFYQIFCFIMSRNYLELRASLRVSNGVFLRQNEQVFVNFFLGGGPQTPPPPQCIHTVWIKRIKRYKQKVTHHNVYDNQPNPPSPFWLFSLLKFKIRCSDPPPPPPMEKFSLDPHLQWVFVSVSRVRNKGPSHVPP